MADEQSGFPILHDTYVKLFELRSPKINVGRFLCDEFQDANPVLASIVRQQEGQKIIVGDTNQQIYRWRGAVNALGEFTHQDNVSTHNLTHSFRFGPEIAGLANRVLRGLGSSTQIRGVGSRIAKPDARKQVTVIARHNMTLLEHALAASERNQSFHLAGSSVELSRMIRSSYALYRGDMSNIKHPDLVGYESWKEFKATARLVNDPLLCQLASITDKYKARALDLADTITRQKSTPERDADIVLTTVHKAKGRQWSQVILAADLALDAKLIAKLQGRGELSLEEREVVNVLYVALTRPKHSLSLPPSVQDTLKKLRDIPLPGTANTHLQTTHQTDPMREAMQDDPDSDSGRHRTTFQPA
jgi:superfamily I DNA/RNA helicase